MDSLPLRCAPAGNDTAWIIIPSRHHRPCAGDPHARGAALDCIGMAGTRPAMTWRETVKASGAAPATLCSHFVLDNSPNLGYTFGQDLLLTRGALARRRSVGAGTVPCMCRTQVRVTGGPGCVPLTRDWVEAAADLAVTASGGHRTGIACPPKKAVREAASRLFHHSHASASRAAVRATLDT